MTTQQESFNEIYLLNSQTNLQKIFDAANACLCKATALTGIAATISLEDYTPEIINNYLWALNDITREAKWLLEKASCAR
jgi:hypothetical protein